MQEQKEVQIIADVVARYYDLTMDEFKMKTRRRHIVTARHMYHYICHKIIGFTTYKTGFLTDLDHATVLNSCKQIDNWLSYDKKVQQDLKMILITINNGNKYHEAVKLLYQVPSIKLERLKREIEKYIVA